MFTGIIEEIGVIKSIRNLGHGIRIQINANKILEDLKIDESVAINGTCLTAVEVGPNYFTADAVAETLDKSTIKYAKGNDKVNLERALSLKDRLGGHIVQGHVDGIGIITYFEELQTGSLLKIEIPESLENYTIAKGSIAIDGISLTIAKKDRHHLELAIIPHTIKQTTLQFKKVGDKINIEVDFFAKYIEQFLNKSSETKITEDWLKQKGFY